MSRPLPSHQARRRLPPEIEQAFARLPKVMARADAKAGQVERAVVDLAEAVMLQGREGEVFAAVVTDEDERGVRMQLRDLPSSPASAPTASTPATSSG